MVRTTIHRIIEHHAATRGDAIAVTGHHDPLTYRDLNQRANLAARRLQAAGFHRAAYASIRMPRSAELAVVLLAVLKAGGAYVWEEAADHGGRALTIGSSHDDHAGEAVDVDTLLDADTRAWCPNLPILTRESDIACVLRRSDSDAVLVPHATVASLRARAMPVSGPWKGDAGALDLWALLIAGGTAVLDGHAAEAAA